MIFWQKAAFLYHFHKTGLDAHKTPAITANSTSFRLLPAVLNSTLLWRFLTYGGMSVREIEAMAVGLRETQDETCISQSPQFIKYLVDALETAGVPVVTPAGGLGCHVDAKGFLPHVPQTEYPAGALTAAFYIISGVRGMERGTISSVRDVSGKDILADVELLRLAMPRRVFTLSQVKFVADRLQWLYKNRKLIGGLQFEYEPTVLRFFTGRLVPTGRWPEKLVAKFKKDFGSSL